MRVGQTLGPYEIRGRVGMGGGGVIFHAVDRRDGGAAAVKVPRSSSRQDLDALRREIRTIEHLNRAQVPGIVQLIEADRDALTPWFAMEWVDGQDLRSFIQQLWGSASTSVDVSSSSAGIDPAADTETIDWAETAGELGGQRSLVHRSVATPLHGEVEGQRLEVTGQVRRALAVLARISIILRDVHSLGLIHGDLSPRNVLLRASNEPVLLDFGTAIALFEAGLHRESPQAWMRGRGTPGYSAPEVLLGEPLDSRCDIYSLGCIAFELLGGRQPFVASNEVDLARQHLYGEVPALVSRSGVLPVALERQISRMLEKDRAQRTAHIDRLLELISAELDSAAPPAPDRHGGAPLFRSSMHGREPELASLSNGLEAAHAGRGSLNLVRGSVGIGKTRILNEIALSAARKQMTVLVCSGSRVVVADADSSNLGPLELFMPVVRHVVDGLASKSERDSGTLAHLANVAVILKGYTPLNFWRDLVVPEPVAVAPEAALQRGFHSLLALLNTLAADAGLLLVLDDAQWADAVSQHFLSWAAPELAGRRIMALLALRAGSESVLPPSLIGGATIDLTLQALDERATRATVAALLGMQELPESLDDYVLEHAEGNPFFIAEYLSFLIARGWLRLDPQRGWQLASEMSRSELREATPMSVDALISSRIRRLSPDVREVCELGAVLGREFDEDALAAMAAPTEVTEPLRILVAWDILQPLSAGRYRFVHEKFRQFAESRLDPTRQRSLHRLRASSLEGHVDERPAQVTAMLGFHWSNAGEPDRARRWFELAAQHACKANALDAACVLYREAVRAAELCDEATRGDTETLREALGDVLVTRARHGEARNSYSDALRTCDDPLIQARLHRKLAISHWTAHEYELSERALAKASSALAALPQPWPASAWEEHIEITLNHCEQLYFSQSESAQIATFLRELAPLIDARGNPQQRTAFYLNAAGQRQLQARYAFDAQAVELARQAYEASGQTPQEQRADAKFIYAFTLVFGSHAQREQALPLLEEAAREAAQVHAKTLVSRIRAHHAITLLRLGRVERAREAAELAMTSALEARLPPYIAAATACLGWAAWRTGRVSDARPLLLRARETWLSHPHPFPLRWISTFPLLAIAQADDDFGAAATLLADLVNPGQQALPRALDDAVRSAIEACKSEDERKASESISSVIAVAAEHHHC